MRVEINVSILIVRHAVTHDIFYRVIHRHTGSAAIVIRVPDYTFRSGDPFV